MGVSQWQTSELSATYLEGVRGAIPLAAAQIDVLLKIVKLWRPAPRGVIDLGCGDGILGRTVLEHFATAKVWFVDFSDPMLDAAREKMGENQSAIIVNSDLSVPAWWRSLPGLEHVDLVVSGFSIHHQTNRRKRELYAEVYELLAPGGLFLNLEHVASPTPEVGALFEDYFIDHLHVFHRRSEPDKPRDEIAATYYGRPDKVENILAPVDAQCTWLRQIGFVDVDCFFKVFELALFGGRKKTE